MRSGESFFDKARRPLALIAAIGAFAAAGYIATQAEVDLGSVFDNSATQGQVEGEGLSDASSNCPEVAADISDTGDC